MPDIRSKIYSIYRLEQLSSGDTVIHRVHPFGKLLGVFIFIVTVVSFERHALGGLTPLVFYPAVLAALSETPYKMILKRVLIALPFCFFIGAANIFFEKDAAFIIFGVVISRGFVSFAVILLRAALCVSAASILIATTGLPDIARQLRALKIPGVLIIMLEMTYRYIGILFAEAASMYTAYTLRSRRGGGVEIKHAGGFAGCFLIRSFDRAERVYNAMKLRGYNTNAPRGESEKFRLKDAAYVLSIMIFCVLARFFDIAALMGIIIHG